MDSRDHDYISTDTPCPDCGGQLFVDVAYDDWSDGTPHQKVDGYDCQELQCGSQYTRREWALRTRTHSVCDCGGTLASSKPARTRRRT